MACRIRRTIRGAGDRSQTRAISMVQTRLPSDHIPTSPSIDVGTGNFSVSVKHRYSFETDTSATPPDYYDGAVIEYSTDDKTWVDVKNVPGVMITGGLHRNARRWIQQEPSMLAWRSAGASAGFPIGNWVTSSFNFGTALANRRSSCASASGRTTFRVTTTAGTLMKSRSQVLSRRRSSRRCCRAQRRSAKWLPVFSITQADLTERSGGTPRSTGPDDYGGARSPSWQWSQVDGPTVELSGTDTANVAFQAPEQPTTIRLKIRGARAAVSPGEGVVRSMSSRRRIHRWMAPRQAARWVVRLKFARADAVVGPDCFDVVWLSRRRRYVVDTFSACPVADRCGAPVFPFHFFASYRRQARSLFTTWALAEYERQRVVSNNPQGDLRKMARAKGL